MGLLMCFFCNRNFISLQKLQTHYMKYHSKSELIQFICNNEESSVSIGSKEEAGPNKEKTEDKESESVIITKTEFASLSNVVNGEADPKRQKALESQRGEEKEIVFKKEKMNEKDKADEKEKVNINKKESVNENESVNEKDSVDKKEKVNIKNKVNGKEKVNRKEKSHGKEMSNKNKKNEKENNEEEMKKESKTNEKIEMENEKAPKIETETTQEKATPKIKENRKATPPKTPRAVYKRTRNRFSTKRKSPQPNNKQNNNYLKEISQKDDNNNDTTEECFLNFSMDVAINDSRNLRYKEITPEEIESKEYEFSFGNLKGSIEINSCDYSVSKFSLDEKTGKYYECKCMDIDGPLFTIEKDKLKLTVSDIECCPDALWSTYITFDDGYFYCDKCRSRYEIKNKLKEQMKVHNFEMHPLKLYVCYYCREEFEQKEVLLKHQDVHVENDVIEYVLGLERDYSTNNNLY